MVAVPQSMNQAAHNPIVIGGARLGLVARAVVYIVLGILAIEIATGKRNHEADQHGAFATIADHPFGLFLLWVLAIGLLAYGLWRIFRAVTGAGPRDGDLWDRLRSAGSGVAYLLLSASAFAFIAGNPGPSPSQRQRTVTGELMKHTAGRWLVGLVGVIVVAIGIGMLVEGARRKFADELDLSSLRHETRSAVIAVGVVGTIARGVAVVLVGALVVASAITYDASKSTGLDGALHTLARQSYGSWLLGLIALGLITFGVFGFAAARWEKL
ncbi:MAG: DUF1206 domain-containing protein [Actinobacteria bacterium]|nr:DUF1206 domain-containing protein [Actinomycetota bacterium]